MADNEERPVQVPAYQSVMNSYNGSIILLTDPEDVLERLRYTLEGKEINGNGELIHIGEPLMNDNGINRVMSLVRTTVNRGVFLSDFKDAEIKSLMDFLGDTLAKSLMTNRDNFGISDDRIRDDIYFLVLFSCFAALKRAWEAGEKKFWKGSTHELTMRQQGEQPNSGFINKIFGWGKK